MNLVKAIRDHHNLIKASFNQPYSDEWTDDQILNSLTSLTCEGIGLTEIPSLPNVTYLNCSHNNIESLSFLPKCIELNCCGNRLQFLPPLPEAVTIYCANNQLVNLPSFPKCEILDVAGNQLTSLPVLPVAKSIKAKSNPLTFIRPSDYPMCREFLIDLPEPYEIDDKEVVKSTCRHEDSICKKPCSYDRTCRTCGTNFIQAPATRFGRPFWVPSTLPWDEQFWEQLQLQVQDEKLLTMKFAELDRHSNPTLGLVMKCCLARLHPWYWKFYPARFNELMEQLSKVIDSDLIDFVQKIKEDLCSRRPIWLPSTLEWDEMLWSEFNFIGHSINRWDYMESMEMISGILNNLLKRQSDAPGRDMKINYAIIIFRVLDRNRWFTDARFHFREVVRTKSAELTMEGYAQMFEYLSITF